MSAHVTQEQTYSTSGTSFDAKIVLPVLGATIGVILILSAYIIWTCCRRRRRRRVVTGGNGNAPQDDGEKQVSVEKKQVKEDEQPINPPQSPPASISRDDDTEEIDNIDRRASHELPAVEMVTGLEDFHFVLEVYDEPHQTSSSISRDGLNPDELKLNGLKLNPLNKGSLS